MKPLVIQFSGGRTSAFMTKFLCEYWPDREKHICFENTGKEEPETLAFVLECDRRWDLRVVWLEAVVHPDIRKSSTHRIVDFESCSRKGEPYEAFIAKYGIPNMAYTSCTRELKINPLRSYLQSINLTDYETAIGIRTDEQHRINPVTAAKLKLIYPLVDIIQVNKPWIRNWWSQQEFDLQLPESGYKGNCDFCFKKSIRSLVSLTRENPRGLDWWEQMENQYGSVKAPLEPRKFFRGHRSAADIRELAALPTLLDDPDFDVEFDCFCKST